MTIRKTWIAPTILLLLSGCAGSDNPVDSSNGEDQVVIPVDLRDPVAVIESHARALNEKNHAAYVALMEKPAGRSDDAGFRYYIRDDDAEEFPWVSNGWWGYDDESGMLANMMNPDFSGAERPVDTIEMQYTITHQADLADGLVSLRLDADIKVLVAPRTGWLSDTRFEFVLVPGADGFYRIRSIREKALRLRASEASVAGSGWGTVKALYR